MYGNRGSAPILLLCLCLWGRSVADSGGRWSGAFNGLLNAGAWVAGSDTPSADVREDAVAFVCPLPEGVDRHVWDADLDLDLSGRDGLFVDYEFRNPEAFRAATLYLRSGDGWFAVYLPVQGGPRSTFLSRNEFESLDNPDGWDRIDGIRISPWKGSGGEGRLLLRGLRAEDARILLVDPDPASVPGDAEREYARGLADWMAGAFDSLSLPAARIPGERLAEAELASFELALLPYNPDPSEPMLRALNDFMDQGGKLMVFYSGSAELAESAGMRLAPYRSSPGPGAWSAIGFGNGAWPGPDRVYQSGTEHLIPARPSKDGEVLAWWENARGEQSRDPAVAVSPRAAWVSAVLTPEDGAAKRRMLAFLADRLLPELGFARRAAAARLEEVRRRAGIPWETFLDGADDAEVLRALSREADRLAAEQPAEAWDLAERLAGEIDRRMAARTPLPSFDMLGVWDHGDGGRVGGDWPGTLDLLAGAGITDVFTHAGRGRGVPIRLTEWAASRGIKVHAWHICWNLTGVPPSQLRRYGREGRLQVTADGATIPWLCPSNEKNRRMERRRLEALAETAGLEGVHLDYIRWPDGGRCVCPHCLESFTGHLGRRPDWPAVTEGGKHHPAYLDWRAEQITGFVREVSEALRERSPELRLSAAVWPDYPGTVERLGQDWPHWVKRGWLDFVTPMSYTDLDARFRDWTGRHVRLAGDADRVVAGIGFTSAESRLTPAQVLAQARTAAEAGARGIVIFDLNHTFRRELAPVLRLARSPEGVAP